jgi:glycosyltransferase involved in cell wall biosynthesis
LTLLPNVLRALRARGRALVALLLDLAHRNRLLTVLLALGFVLRVMATLAYYPAMLYIDSFGYIQRAYLYDSGGDPMGYSWVLRLLLDVGNLSTVVVFQHLLGLGMAVAIYALLRRYGVRRVLAALAVAPVLLDGYQLQIEQNVLSDTLFEAFIVAGVVVLAWSRRPGLRRLCLGSLLLGCALLVRNAGDVLILVVLLFPLIAVRGLRRKIAALVIAVVGFAVPLLAYASINVSQGGSFGISSQGTLALYGRAATVADCQALPLSPNEKLLCPTQPIGQRYGVDWYVSDGGSPLMQTIQAQGAGKVHADTGHLANRFALIVIRYQTWDFAKAVLGDFLHGFSVDSHVAPSDTPSSRWQFQTTYPVWTPGYSLATAQAESARFGQGGPYVQSTLATALRDYQLDGGSTPGPLLGLCALLGLAGCVTWSRRVRRSGLRPLCALLTVTGLGLLLGADTFEYSLRYQLPGLVLLPAAGAVGLTALTWYRKPLLAAFPDDADTAASDAFRAEYGAAADFSLAPVTVVIAAYNEQDSIAEVLRRVPGKALGMPVDVVVVVDGASDGTAAAARAAAAEPAIQAGAVYVCDVPVNRGQGAALRLGYALAREGGAEYVVTTDADGQYDIEDVDRMIEPLVEDRADFVTGSRILGQQQTNDMVRRAGVHVFARLVSLLTRQQVTDTSFGLRAMRAAVTEEVTLEQPQYQSSELLISTLANGYRVQEVPMLMRVRANGRSKKGNNLVYGNRYARVVLRTWWRERRLLKTTPSKSRNLSTNMTP